MSELFTPSWYVVGYLRTVPEERAFVFPVVQNADVAVRTAYVALNGKTLKFVEPDSQEALVRISPIGIGSAQLEEVLPLYGYEFDSGKAWFGDACQLAKELVDFSCKSEVLTTKARTEIANFVNDVIIGSEFVAKSPVFLEGRATFSESWCTDDVVASPKIMVIGVGGGGHNAIENMTARGVQGVEFVHANTDAQALHRSKANTLLQLGTTGMGAGSKPEIGRAAAEEAVERIKECLAGTNMLFIVAGLGGGTGTGAAPVIARVAKGMGILTVGVVTKPFEFEGMRRGKQADDGVSELEANVDSLIVVLNEKLLEVMGDDVTQEQAFAYANDVLKNAVGGISDIINIPGLVNVDFEDVKTVMNEPGKAMMATAVAGGPDRATRAAEDAVASPLMEGIDLGGARGVLVMIAASKATFKLAESRNAMNAIRRNAADDAHVIFGTAYDETLGDKLRVTVIATGLRDAGMAAIKTPLTVAQPQNPVLRTGTDNLPILNTVAKSRSDTQALPQHRYEGLNPPSAWRTAQAKASAKVDALVSNGLDEFEIPAFLRKQAD
jgi:cell division protein FtsZ